MSADIEQLISEAMSELPIPATLGGHVAEHYRRRRQQKRRVAVVSAVVAMSAATVTGWPLISGFGAADTSRLIPAAVPSISARSALSPELQHQIDERTAFGLNADPGYVRSLQSKPGLDIGMGFPITPAEVKIFDARNKAGLALASVTQLLTRTEPNTFGGAWIDQAGGGDVVLASTDPQAVDLAAVKRLLPAGTRIVVQQVAESYAYLEKLQVRISDDTELNHRDGVGYGIFVMQNNVTLTVPTALTLAAVDALYAKFGRRGLLIQRVDTWSRNTQLPFATPRPADH